MRKRRCRSAFGKSACPHCATGLPRRVAVSTSCRRRRERTCMCTSPEATSGRSYRFAVSRRDCNLALSFGPQWSSTAIHAAPRNRSASQRRRSRLHQAPRAPARRNRRALDVVASERVPAFLAAPPAERNQRGNRAIGAPVGREDDELHAVDEELGAVHELKAAFLRLQVRAHRAGEGALVGQRKRPVAELARAIRAPPDATRRAGS